MTKTLMILDYGNPYTDELTHFLDQAGLSYEVLPHSNGLSVINQADEVAGIILSGGPFTEYDDDIDQVDAKIFKLGIPLLGIGRGMQVMIHELGGTVTPAGYQFAPAAAVLKIHNTQSGLFKDMVAEKEVMLGFDAKVSELPQGFEVVANGQGRPFGAIENPTKKLYGVQFVLDLKDNAFNQNIIQNFLKLCQDA